jgi:hypothetical protein
MNISGRPPAHAAPAGASRGISRRGLLLGAAAVVLAGGGGIAVGVLRPVGHEPPTGRPPADLVAALAAERALIASIDATSGGTAPVRAALHQIKADHVAHRIALQAAVDGYPDPPTGARAGRSRPAVALHVAELRSAEQHASAQAASRAARLSGRDAALLASIAACEACHAELLFG